MELIGSKVPELVPLSPNDIPFVGTFRTMLYLYRRAPDAGRLRATLRQLIREVPDISGRLAQHGSDFFIARNDAGVEFDLRDVKYPMPEYGFDQPIDADTNLDLQTYADQPRSLEGVLCAFRMTRFSCGGAILAMEISHALADGHGRGWLLARWARLCRGAPPLPPLDLNRSQLIELATTCTDDAALQRKFVTLPLPDLAKRFASKTSEPTAYKVFRVSAHRLAELHESYRSRMVVSQWFSQQDVLTAKLWHTIAMIPVEETKGTLSMPQNFRRNASIGVGPQYFGNAINFARTHYDLGEVRAQPIEALAAHVRTSVTAALKRERIIDELYSAWRNRGSTGSGLVMIPLENLGTLDNDFIHINNLSRFPVSELDFGTGAPFWVGGLKQPTPRTATIFPLSGDGANPGFAIHVHLTVSQMTVWSELVSADPFFHQ